MNHNNSNGASSTEPLIMSQSFNMVPIPSSSNYYTKNFRSGDSRNNNNKSRNDSELTQAKVIEGGTNITQIPSPLRGDSDLTQVKVIEDGTNITHTPSPLRGGSDLTQVKVIEDGTNITQTQSPLRGGSDLTQAKVIEDGSTNAVQAASLHKEKATVVNINSVPIHSGTTEESTHTVKFPDMPRGASFPGAKGADKYDEWDYLIPTDPPPYPHVNMPASSTSDPLPRSTHTDSNFGNTGTRGNGHQGFHRSDSGLGSDQSERGSGATSSKRRAPNSPLPMSPPLPTHYEAIEQCQRRPTECRTGAAPGNSYPQYPYYTPVIDDQTSVKKSEKSRNCRGCCLVLTCLIILLISLAALAVSIYVFITRPDSNRESVVYAPVYNVTADGHTSQNLTQILRDVKAEFNVLKEETTQLTQDKEKLHIALQTLEDKLDTQMANISQVPGPQGPQGPQGSQGPQGPPGIVNFSACIHRTISKTEKSHNVDTEIHTGYLPELKDMKEYYAHFAYCEFKGATVGLLSHTEGPRFSCTCKGARDLDNIYCYVHVWMCPYGD